jgi:hypothetical protein
MFAKCSRNQAEFLVCKNQLLLIIRLLVFRESKNVVQMLYILFLGEKTALISYFLSIVYNVISKTCLLLTKQPAK